MNSEANRRQRCLAFVVGFKTYLRFIANVAEHFETYVAKTCYN